jgi:serine/threonine protein kinase
LTGLPPFYDENTNEMYRKILQEPLTFPGPEIVPPAARDLLTRLLDRDPQRRLGSNGAAEIKAHHFFSNIDWRKLLQRKYEPTFKPNVVCLFFFLLFRVDENLLTRLSVGCTGHDPIRQGLHGRSSSGLVRGGTATLTDNAAAIHRLVVQPTDPWTQRCGRQCQRPVIWQYP